MGLKEQILGSEDLPREAVHVPEWNCTVHIRTMPAIEKDAFEASCMDGRFANVRARLVVRCLVDADGKRIFEDTEAKQLGGKNSNVMSRLYDVATRLNGMSESDVKELEKNYEEPQVESLSTT